MSDKDKSRIKLDDIAQPQEELTAAEIKQVKGGAEHDVDKKLPSLSDKNFPDPLNDPGAPGFGAPTGGLNPARPGTLGVRPIIKK